MNSFLSTSSGERRERRKLARYTIETFRLKIYPFKTRDREPPLERTEYFRLSLYFRHRRAFNDPREAFQPFENEQKNSYEFWYPDVFRRRNPPQARGDKSVQNSCGRACRRVKYTQSVRRSYARPFLGNVTPAIKFYRWNFRDRQWYSPFLALLVPKE